MIPITTPAVASFLQYVYENYPDIKSFKGVEVYHLKNLIREFERGVNSEVRGISERLAKTLPVNKKNRLWLVREDKLIETLSRRDYLERYHRVPTKGVFFYTTEEHEIRKYIDDNWNALHEKTGNNLDFFDYEIRTKKPTYESWTQVYMRALANIPGIDQAAAHDAGLPFLLLWNPRREYVVVPFSDVYDDPKKLRTRMKDVIACVKDKPLDIDSISYLKDIRFEAAREPDARLGQPEPCDVFISYSHSNRQQIQNLVAALQSEGITPWFDDFIRCGENWARRIYWQLREATAVVICWTSTSVKSPWVLREASTARVLGKYVFPIAFESGLKYPESCGALHTLDLSRNHSQMVAELISQIRASLIKTN